MLTCSNLDSDCKIRLINDKDKRQIHLRAKGKQKVPARTIACVRAASDLSIDNSVDICVSNGLNFGMCRVGKTLNRLDDKNEVLLHVTNLSDNDVTFDNNHFLATTCVINEIVDDLPSGTDFETKPEKLLKQASNLDISHLTKKQQEELLSVINDNREAFSTPETPIGCIKGYEATIDTEEGKVSYRPQYRVPEAHIQPLEKIISELVSLKIVEKSDPSPFNSPVMLVKKANNPNEFRLVSDMRGLNSITKQAPYPLPRITDILNKLKGKKYFSTLDAKIGYFNMVFRYASCGDKLIFFLGFVGSCIFGAALPAFSFVFGAMIDDLGAATQSLDGLKDTAVMMLYVGVGVYVLSWI